MFTGIIQELGTIINVVEKNGIKKFTVESEKIPTEVKIGDSVSVDGCCLTVVKKTEKSFEVEAIPETLQRTIAGSYQAGSKVNLELPLQLGGRLDGHLVSGHVDSMNQVTNIENVGDSKVLTVDFPLTMAKYFAFKGSVTINGVSLTISKLNKNSFEVTLIPHSQKVTNVGDLKKGDMVNIEIDLIARYLENMLKDKEEEAGYFFLQERGLL